MPIFITLHYGDLSYTVNVANILFISRVETGKPYTVVKFYRNEIWADETPETIKNMIQAYVFDYYNK